MDKTLSQKDLIYETITSAAQYIKQYNPFPEIEIGIICGSGLNVIVDIVEDGVDIQTKNIPGYPTTSVEGHSSVVTIGKIAGKSTICFQGRNHYYEGLPMWQVTMPVRIMKLLGVKVVFVTNAAGGVDKTYNVGDVMLIKDHINLCGLNPLLGENDPRWGPRFPDLRDGYDNHLRTMCKEIFKKTDNVKFREGVYCMMSGPSYETNAELLMMRKLGVGTVGMSTAPEVIVANHAGLRVCAMSSVATILEDENSGDSPLNSTGISHEVVLQVAKECGLLMAQVIQSVVSRL